MVVQMCDFMNSQETRIAYLKWRSQKGITCTWYMLRYCLLLRHEKQRVARRSSVRCVRKEKKSCHPVTSLGTLRNVWRGTHRRVSLGRGPLSSTEYICMPSQFPQLCLLLCTKTIWYPIHTPIMPWVNKEDNNANE